jgi:hypothetical protein
MQIDYHLTIYYTVGESVKTGDYLVFGGDGKLYRYRGGNEEVAVAAPCDTPEGEKMAITSVLYGEGETNA